ncbi:MAG: glutamate--tRNA ligase [Gemmatimonadetes bacterium]|nr:glutamate--tRNA ligase [Gemmatimonadota bacterium]
MSAPGAPDTSGHRAARPPRVRFAPSPTGHLHVGGARTALFNYLFARNAGGTFVLRIEDTDRGRSSDEMTRSILDAMEWLGLDFDEGPYHQADGLERHRADAHRLLEIGAAYRCFCPPPPGRAGRPDPEGCGCATLSRADEEARAAAGEPFALRFRVPDGETAWDDAVHGRRAVANEHVQDFVLLRSDGTPVYNLAVVSDDIEMGITLVLRGDDHLSNTPKQILLYRALGAPLPTFAHVPMILGPDGRRLSKRHGGTSLEAYREQGILPEALFNFLALLGWSPGDDREVMEPSELIEAFSLGRILKKSAVFDPEKLTWLNRQHITRMPIDRLVELASGPLQALGVPSSIFEERPVRVREVLDVVRERGDTVEAVALQAAPFFLDEVTYEEAAVTKFWKRPAEAAELLRAARDRLAEVASFEPDTLEHAIRQLAATKDVGAGKIIHPLRVAQMGTSVSPGIFVVLSLMGRERVLGRIDRALGYLDAMAAAEGAGADAE